MTDEIIEISILCFVQLLVITILRYTMKHWIFSHERILRDATETAKVNPASLAQEFRKQIEEGASLQEIVVRENRKYIRRNRFEMLVVGGGHLLFVVLIIAAFFMTGHPWLFLAGSIALFLFFVVGTSGTAKE